MAPGGSVCNSGHGAQVLTSDERKILLAIREDCDNGSEVVEATGLSLSLVVLCAAALVESGHLHALDGEQWCVSAKAILEGLC